jgi:hypothetical protein
MIPYLLIFVLSVFANDDVFPHSKIMDCHTKDQKCDSNEVCTIEVFSSFEAKWLGDSDTVKGTITWAMVDGDTKMSMPAEIIRMGDDFKIRNLTTYPPKRDLIVSDIKENSESVGDFHIKNRPARVFTCKRYSNPK